MKTVNKIAPLFFFLLISGCATQKTVFVPAQPSVEKGSVLYLYRESGFSSLVFAPGAIIKNNAGEETNAGKLGQGEYKLMHLFPGQYEVQLEAIKYYAPGNAITIDVKPDSINYLQIDTSLKFEASTRYKAYERKYSLRKVDESVALDLIADCVDVDSRPMKKGLKVKKEVNESDEGVVEQDEDNKASFSIEKTADPFSRNQ